MRRVLGMVNREKHPHPRRYKRALRLCITGVILGAVMTAYGLYVVQGPLPGLRVWLSSLILGGPVLIFLSLIAYSTYLETLEADRYGGIYQDEEPQGAMAH